MLKDNRQAQPWIEIVPVGHGQKQNLILLLNGQSIDAPRGTIVLLERLNKTFGRVVAYDELLGLIGQSGNQGRHTLRQHILGIRRLLTEHNAPHVLAVVSNVGYALCELAVNASAGHSQGLSDQRLGPRPRT